MNQTFKRVFLGLSILLIVLMPILGPQFGVSGDEDVESQYGRDIYNYFFHGDTAAVYYPESNVHYGNLHFYGGMFNYVTELIHKVFPQTHIYHIRHIVGGFVGAWLMIFTGLIAYRMSGKRWSIGLLALLFIALSPRIFGESMFNGKDIPFALGFAMSIYFLHRFFTDFQQKPSQWIAAIGLGVGWGITFGSRSAGAMILIGYIGVYAILYLWAQKSFRAELLADKYKVGKKFALQLFVAMALGLLMGYLCWPYGIQSPIGNLIASFQEMSNRSVNLRVLFEGGYRSSTSMPWYYEFKWIAITNPIIVIVASALFLVLLIPMCKKWGKHIALFLAFAALFPLLYIIYKKSTVYDTWRHVFFVYPFIVIMASLTIAFFMDKIKNVKYQFAPYAVAILLLLPTLVWAIKAHPHQYVYFNAFAGGVKGAEGYYDLDYYLTSSKATAEWVLKNAERPKDGRKLKVAANMEALEFYFRNDTNWIEHKYLRYNDRNNEEWDYYITYSRFVSEWKLQEGKWPPSTAVYKVEVDNTPIGVVLKQPSKDAALAYAAYQQNNFELAAQLYANYLEKDASDEMVLINYAIALAQTGKIPQAIEAVNKAIALDPTSAQVYQLMSQLYQATGNRQQAEYYMQQYNSLMLEMQRKMEGED